MNIISSSKQFISEVQTELSKVVWPSRDEFVGSTIIVLFLVCLFAIYFGFLDVFFTYCIQFFFRLFI